MSSARFLRFLLIFLKKSLTATLNSLLFSIFFFFALLFLCVMALFSFLSCVLFLYLEIRATKSMWPRVSFWKPRIAFLLMLHVAALSVNMWEVLFVITLGWLQQLLQYFLWFRLILVHMKTSSLSFLQVYCCGIPSIKLELFDHLQ